MHDAIRVAVTSRAAWRRVALAAASAALTVHCAQPAPPPAAPVSTVLLDARGEDAAIRARRHLGRRQRAAGERAQRAGRDGARRASHGRVVPRTGLGGQRDRAHAAGRRSDARRRGTAPLLPDQQGPVVAARRQRVVPRSGRRHSGQAAAGELLSGGLDARRSRQVDLRIARPGARRRGGLLQRHPARQRRPALGGPLQRPLPQRARRRGRPPARRPPR